MTRLHDMIEMVLDHPETYIKRRSVQRLYAFLSGFLFENEAANDHCLDGFEQYIAARYRITAGHTWADIIELFSNTDHGEIQLFHKYFDQYIQTQQQGFRH